MQDIFLLIITQFMNISSLNQNDSLSMPKITIKIHIFSHFFSDFNGILLLGLFFQHVSSEITLAVPLE